MHETVLVQGRRRIRGGVTHAHTSAPVFQSLRSGMNSRWAPLRHGHFVFELETLVALGLSPIEAISACTRQAADALGLQDRTGTLEPGKWADVIATPLDPSQDVSRLRDVRFVMKGGVRQDLSLL